MLHKVKEKKKKKSAAYLHVVWWLEYGYPFPCYFFFLIMKMKEMLFQIHNYPYVNIYFLFYFGGESEELYWNFILYFLAKRVVLELPTAHCGC